MVSQGSSNVNGFGFVVKPEHRHKVFHILEENREVKDGRVEAIAENLDQCNLLDVYPIVTDGEMNVYDGQHRLRAAWLVGRSVYAISGEGVEVKNIAFTNANTFGYDSKDYLHVYANLGGQSYEALLRELDSWGVLSSKSSWVSRFACLFGGGPKYGQVLRSPNGFADGAYEFTTPDYANMVLRLWVEAGEINKSCGSAHWLSLFASVCQIPGFDRNRMLDGLANFSARQMKAGKLAVAFERAELAYNYNRVAANRINLQASAALAVRPRANVSLTGIDQFHVERAVDRGHTVSVRYVEDAGSLRPHPSTRVVSDHRLRKMRESISTVNLLRFYPVIVDKQSGLVLDGNIRAAAAKDLGVGIYVIETRNVSLKMIVDAASVGSRWSQKDYVHLYSQEGNKHYISLGNFIDRHEGVDIETVIRLSGGGFYSRQHDFRMGRFKFPYSEAERFVGYLEGMGLDHVLQRRVGRPFAEIYRSDRKVAGQLAERVNRYGVYVLKKMGDRILNNQDAYDFFSACWVYRRKVEAAPWEKFE